ncbi:methyltransferase domain-containing protein [Phycicoccus sp. M110.8]|uniref:class I SAM-dependent methyltransferase n=1 Tax=Phycicoccus sp. M110.8 TaxID=3075433 RepID=UPI0028FD9AF9|nr:methyltransferase domain-containing protein [Phycicoccus sp. M110.8]MDU0313521.1 methyltransferase domain-containing protein [Phycicoccus sp. M110.8]
MARTQDSPDSSTDLRRPVFSRVYARASERIEPAGMADLRRELLAPLRGRVVEVGCGNGLNFAHYPAAVTEVVGVEPEPRLRELAVQRAGEASAAGRPVTVVPGRAEELPLPDASADAAVLCLVLCSVADPQRAVAEVARVLRPGGTVRFLEHTVAEGAGLRRVQRLVDATLWPLLVGGCHTSRDQVADLEAAGFEVTGVRRFRFPDTGPTTPASPHVLGEARLPA